VLLALACAWTTLPASAQSVARNSQALSNAAGLSAYGSGLVLAGSVEGAAASGQLVVDSVTRTGEAVVIVLRGASDGAKVSLQFAADALAVTSLMVGASVVVVSEATGHALMYGGRLVAYLPNEMGRAMVYQARHDGSRP
jgi:hypothetical protein